MRLKNFDEKLRITEKSTIRKLNMLLTYLYKYNYDLIIKDKRKKTLKTFYLFNNKVKD